EVPTVHMSGEERLALRKELEIRENSVVISYIAELNKNKNHQFLLKNWNEIKLLSPNAILLIIGKGNYEDELKRYVLEKNINDVKFLGFRSNIHQLLELSDIVTLLSHREGLPKSIMEAMVAKLPVVVTDTRGLRDLIINNENGFVVSHEDKIGLINAFVSLINNENLRKQMGENGFEKVQKYRLENVLKEYSFIYEDLLRKDG
ncbi:MAG: glycosyltransferase, partial [Melioribacteraceae bacterium]|nr:glycosyltransferase [Melioribacteraceae bacterium]